MKRKRVKRTIVIDGPVDWVDTTMQHSWLNTENPIKDMGNMSVVMYDYKVEEYDDLEIQP